jgi:hypothetical protein
MNKRAGGWKCVLIHVRAQRRVRECKRRRIDGWENGRLGEQTGMQIKGWAVRRAGG